MRRLTISASVNTFTGYGQLFCELFSGLERNGVFCAVRAIDTSELFGCSIPVEIKSRYVHCQQPEPWELLIKNPNHLPTPGRKTVMFTMYESTVLPREWVETLNRAELLIVPCEWCRNGFRKSGVTVPIEVVPLGYAEEVFHYLPPKPSGPFTFGIAGRVSHGKERKGIRRAIDLWQQTFREIKNVNLAVKVHPDCDIGTVEDSRITVTRSHLNWAKVRQWFGGIDVFLSLAKAEGFGLWQIQAMASGRPVMAAPYSGMAEYLTKENGFCLPYKETANPEYGGGLWAEVDDETIKTAMLYAFTHREEVRQKGYQAAADARRFTWGNTVEKVYQILNKNGAI